MIVEAVGADMAFIYKVFEHLDAVLPRAQKQDAVVAHVAARG